MRKTPPKKAHHSSRSRPQPKQASKTRTTVQPTPIQNLPIGVTAPIECPDLGRVPNILDRVVDAMDQLGVVGEHQILKLVYLAMTSRFLKKIVSLVVKGPSSGGKTYLVQQIIRLFPTRAYHVLTSMSDKALVYSGENFEHRIIVLYEAEGLGTPGEYLVRSLISEGHIRHEVTEKGEDNRNRARVVQKDGPTGFILTTTRVQLHPENETRMISLTVTDTPEQTRRILLAQAAGKTNPPTFDVQEFHDLQQWLEKVEHRVVIPFAPQLVEFIPLTEIRIRRDFPTILGLIEAHALLHQASRPRDHNGCIVAILEDYAAVRELVNGTLGDGLGAMVKLETREVVDAVTTLNAAGIYYPTVTTVAKHLSLSKSAALRRIEVALERGYLVNNQEHRGQPAKLRPGEPMPDDADALPHPSKLAGCTVARVSEGPRETEPKNCHADS